MPEIQDVAHHVGDSLALSRIAATAPQSTIVFCGVHFMAETAKILSPDKTVLIPDAAAGCSLADSLTADQLRAWKAENPGAVVVSYVNTTAEVKAETDICCTSSNAVEVVAVDPGRHPGAVRPGPVPRCARAPGARPGQHLGLGRRVPRARRDQRRPADRAGRGATRTPTCTSIPSAAARPARCTWPRAGAVPAERVKILSTGEMVDAARISKSRQVLVATEIGMIHQLRKAAPGVDFQAVNERASCKYMKMITPDKLLRSLREMRDEVVVDPDIAARARGAVERMIAIGQSGGGE